MRIMVTGYKGMLGKEVCAAVTRMGHSLVAQDVDVTDMPVTKIDASVVINCAGLVPQRDPEPSPSRLMKVNGYGPWHLAGWCDRIGARLIHVSTDCVFDGSGSGLHFEKKNPWPITPYGKSKLAGEVTDDPHLTVRTSFVGLGERGLIAELMRCVENNIVYKASDELLWSGHIARFVAEALVMLAERDITGLIHIPGETMTRHKLVLLLQEALELDDLQFSRHHTPEIDRRLESSRWKKNRLPELPSFKWQLEWLRRSQ